jgi:Domain of unknown function (DUF6429)
MELDTNKIDDAILALLYLGLHNGARAWKGFDWDAMDRLHQSGYISDPRSKAKPVVFTEEGLEQSQRLLEKLFGKKPDNRAAPDTGGIRRGRGSKPIPTAQRRLVSPGSGWLAIEPTVS